METKPASGKSLSSSLLRLRMTLSSSSTVEGTNINSRSERKMMAGQIMRARELAIADYQD